MRLSNAPIASPSELRESESLFRSLRLGLNRTPRELHELLETIDRRVKKHEFFRIARSRQGLWKRYYEEIRPLALFTRPLLDRVGVYCTPSLSDSLNYDAVIDLPSDRKVLVEITSSENGYEASLRNEVLRREGHVCSTGTVTIIKRQGSRDRAVHVEYGTKTKTTAVDEMRRAFAARIEKKAAKNYGDSTVLIVTFDDHWIGRDDIHQIRDEITSELGPSARCFEGIYLLGLSNGTRIAMSGVPELD